MKSLREICTEICASGPYGIRSTDKNRGTRQHLSLYEEALAPYRQKAKKVFEIGVNKAGSIRMWQEYFQNAEIFGLDIRQEVMGRISKIPRVTGVVLDQSSDADLDAFAARGPFDVGIDDGSHIWEHQIKTFEKLFPAMRPGGLYVIEDTVTSYSKWLNETPSVKDRGYDQNGSPSCIEYFKKMIDHINFEGANYDAEGFKFTEFQRTIDWIVFRTNAVFVKKRVTDVDPWVR